MERLQIMRFLVVLLISLALTHGFRASWIRTKSTSSRVLTHARKVPSGDDVFSAEGPAKGKSPKTISVNVPKQSDQLEELIVEPLSKDGHEESTEEVPMFAVAYKFKESLSQATLEEHTKSHREYCQKFSSLLYDETMETVSGRGTVSLWVGQPNDDGSSLRAEIDRFVEDDPLLKEGLVAKWDIIDLQASDKPLPPALEKEAAELERQRNDELERLYHENQSSSATA